MGPNPKHLFQLAVLILALVVFLGIYLGRKRLRLEWKPETANRYFRLALSISLWIFVLAIAIVIWLNN
jgi:hypothetical protein